MTEFVLSEIKDRGGCLMLNRPFSINALNLAMIREITRVLKEWETNPQVEFVLLEGAGDKGFCAGGDIKIVYLEGRDALAKGEDATAALRFFEEEYALNKYMFHYPKPIAVYMHGITMGGGVGLSAPCKYRIGAENLKWAMPETGIGFFPDVGAAYYLAQMPYNAGMNLGLTGNTIGPDNDLLAALGIITHVTPLSEWRETKKRILYQGVSLLDDFKAEARTAPGFIKFMNKTEAAWTQNDFESLIKKLMTGGLHEKGPDTAQMIMKRSPHSLIRTFLHLQWAKDKSFDEVIAQDAKLAAAFLQHPDFYEGIRAAVVDKDKKPKWAGAKQVA
ncbi:MAG: hypothetical protein GC136_05755 [Alphaproteobacteria bacterium]|nr:hypothetical protein [Alphaproteobacteria bacterium]